MADGPVLRFGVIGIGAGFKGLFRAFETHPGVKIVAACDVRQDALDRFAQDYGVATYLDPADLCSDPNVDAVWIASPNQYHAQQAIIAAEHKKHTIVSKPMAVTLDECMAMIDAADKNGIKLMAGHTQGILPGIRKMASLVRSGEYGDLGMVNSWNYSPWIYRPRLPQELDEATGGGIVFRQSPHHIDMVRIIAGGKVRSVRAMTKIMDPSRPVPGIFAAYLEFDNDVPCTIVYNGYGHFDSSELTFPETSERRSEAPEALVRGAAVSAEQEAAMKEARRFTGGAAESGGGGGGGTGLSPFGLTIASLAKADIRQYHGGVAIYQNGKSEFMELGKGEPRGYPELEELYQAVVYDREVVHDGRWGLATQEVTDAINLSSRERREIMMQHQVAFPEGAPL